MRLEWINRKGIGYDAEHFAWSEFVSSVGPLWYSVRVKAHGCELVTHPEVTKRRMVFGSPADAKNAAQRFENSAVAELSDSVNCGMIEESVIMAKLREDQ